MSRATALFLAALCLGACGGDDAPAAPDSGAGPYGAETGSTSTPAAASASRPKAVTAAGTTIVARGSEFGRMLFNSKRQAIYIFQRDGRRRSNCYGECARAWPPVFTRGKPRAGRGVKASLLGTTRRRDGRLQVTYNGKPLYYYAHEGPGQVLCHNVSLNGGLWWVIGPNGKRRP